MFSCFSQCSHTYYSLLHLLVLFAFLLICRCSLVSCLFSFVVTQTLIYGPLFLALLLHLFVPINLQAAECSGPYIPFCLFAIQYLFPSVGPHLLYDVCPSPSILFHLVWPLYPWSKACHSWVFSISYSLHILSVFSLPSPPFFFIFTLS